MKKINKAIKKEEEKESLEDSYAQMVYITCVVVGNWLLGILGAAADGLVLTSIFYLAIGRIWVSIGVGFVVAILIQIVIGLSLSRAGISHFKGMSKDPDHRVLIRLMVAIALVSFGATIFFAINSDKIVRMAATANRDFKTINKYEKEPYFDAKIDSLEKKKLEMVQMYQSIYKDLMKDSVLYRGLYQPNSYSVQKAHKIASETIPSILDRYDQRIEKVRQGRSKYLSDVDKMNSKNDQEADRSIKEGEDTMIFVNVSINSLRIILILFYAFFIGRSVKERLKMKGGTIGGKASNPSFEAKEHPEAEKAPESEQPSLSEDALRRIKERIRKRLYRSFGPLGGDMLEATRADIDLLISAGERPYYVDDNNNIIYVSHSSDIDFTLEDLTIKYH